VENTKLTWYIVHPGTGTYIGLDETYLEGWTESLEQRIIETGDIHISDDEEKDVVRFYLPLLVSETVYIE